jgi:hypothetical protein
VLTIVIAYELLEDKADVNLQIVRVGFDHESAPKVFEQQWLQVNVKRCQFSDRVQQLHEVNLNGLLLLLVMIDENVR